MLFALSLAALPLAAQTKPAPTLADGLLEARSSLVLADGKLSGPGADVLRQRIAQSRYVLVGEDHMTREIPQLVAALCDVMHPDAYAVEAGPDAAGFVSGLLRSPDRVAQMAARSKAHPNNMAFLDMREENDLAAHCAAASGNANFKLWGLDQEFVGAAGTLLEAMKATRPGPKTLAAIAGAEAKEQAADKAARASGDPSGLFLMGSKDADTQRLDDAVAADGNAETKRLLYEFTESRAIYRLNAEGSAESNSRRATLLKRHFVADYASIQKTEPKVLLKFGDWHVYRGFNPLHELDLGDFVAEQADGEGAKSLHVLVLGARGTHVAFAGYAKPLAHEPFVMTEDGDYKWLTPAVADLLPQSGAGETMTMFDLRKLRFKGIDLPRDWERVVYGYDLFVLIPELTPGSAIE